MSKAKEKACIIPLNTLIRAANSKIYGCEAVFIVSLFSSAAV